MIFCNNPTLYIYYVYQKAPFRLITRGEWICKQYLLLKRCTAWAWKSSADFDTMNVRARCYIIISSDGNRNLGTTLNSAVQQKMLPWRATYSLNIACPILRKRTKFSKHRRPIIKAAMGEFILICLVVSTSLQKYQPLSSQVEGGRLETTPYWLYFPPDSKQKILLAKSSFMFCWLQWLQSQKFSIFYLKHGGGEDDFPHVGFGECNFTFKMNHHNTS